MRKIPFICLFLAILASVAELPATGAVAYKLNKGRFGDNLLTLSHAAWFAYLLDLPLVYTPFDYSDQLKLDEDTDLLRECPPLPKLTLHTPADYHRFYAQLAKQGQLQDSLIEVPFYPDTAYLFERNNNHPQFTQIDWNNPDFKKRLQQWITPKNPLPKLQLPQDKCTVALHYRTGEVYDKKKWKTQFPLKWPPDQYYIDALNHLKAIQNKPLYVYIFTDSPNPLSAKGKFECYFRSQGIEFACRTEGSPQENVLEDFFAFDGFDCLIRPESYFSFMAARLFDYKMVFSPAHFYWVDQYTIAVDQILLEFKTEQGTLFQTTFRNLKPLSTPNL